MSYFNIHNHTEYSNINLSADSTNKIDKLILRAKELGLRGVAITDHGLISSHIKALNFIKQKREEDESWKDFVLGLGEEIYLCENGRSKETAERGQRYPHCILVAKDEIGHSQLRKITSKAWERAFTLFVRRIPSWYSDLEEIIGNDKGHLIITTACIGGILREAYDEKSFEEAEKIIQWMAEWFPDDFYIEMAPAGYEEQIDYNKWLIELSKKLNLKLIFATDSHYLKKEDFKIHEAYLKTKEEERETGEFYSYTYLMSLEECKELLNYIGDDLFKEAVLNTNEIADKITFYDLFQPQIIPHLDDDRYKFPKWEYILKTSKIQEKYKYINEYKNSQEEDDRYFIYLVLMKLKELNLSKEKLEKYLERIEIECYEYWETSVRLKQPITSYILMVREVERIMWEEAESLVGISRGSAGSTLVNYLCGLTQMNPLEQGIYLPEWRFIHHSKIEIPDVDVDSEASKKDLIRQKLKEKAMSTGGDAVAICTFGTEGSRSAVLTAARSLGLTPDEGQYISSLIKQERGFSWSISDCYFGNEDKEREPVQDFIDAVNSHEGLLDIILGIEGLVCRSGIHACGVNILNSPIYVHNALMRAPNGTETTQFDLGDSDYMGGLKMDCLTVEALDKIHKCMDLLIQDGLMEWQGDLKSTYNKYLHPDVLLRDEQNMWSLISANKIIDAFQMDSTVAKQSLAAIKPKTVPQLAQLNTLMRLVPEKGKKTPTEEYVEFKNTPLKLKQEVYALNATDEEKSILYDFMKEYGGILDSQESAMLAVMLPFTNYDVPHANKIRKIIAKKKLKEIDSAREEYFKTGLEIGTSEDILKYIWDVQIKRQLG